MGGRKNRRTDEQTNERGGRHTKRSFFTLQRTPRTVMRLPEYRLYADINQTLIIKQINCKVKVL
jgi:hypothetical protein